MAETSTTPPKRRAQDGKITAAQTAVVTTTGGLGVSWFLWGYGCLKGHQWFWPDDALMITTAGMLAPMAQFFWAKFERKIGYTPPQQQQDAPT